jgi:hypothetical protein
MTPQVPDLPAEWPPTAEQLAMIASRTQWLLSDLAYELPRHTVTRANLDDIAGVLEGLAGLLRKHEVNGREEPNG